VDDLDDLLVGAGQGPVGPERVGLWGKGGGASRDGGTGGTGTPSRRRDGDPAMAPRRVGAGRRSHPAKAS
jgi:hypothetical protein